MSAWGIPIQRPFGLLRAPGSVTLTGNTARSVSAWSNIGHGLRKKCQKRLSNRDSNDLAGRRSIFPVRFTGCRTAALRKIQRYRKRKWVALPGLTRCRSKVENVPRITPDFHFAPLEMASPGTLFTANVVVFACWAVRMRSKSLGSATFI